eukprot:14679925-Ditylum_brightwellii.AAC.1
MVFFTSVNKPVDVDNGLANKQNMIAETLAIVFLVTRSDTPKTRHATSEPYEHTFGCWRVMIQEPTVHKMTELIGKTDMKLKVMYESDLVGQRSNK